MDYLVVMGINDEGGASHGLVDRYAVITNKLSWGQERPFCEVPGLPDDPFCGEAAPAPATAGNGRHKTRPTSTEAATARARDLAPRARGTDASIPSGRAGTDECADAD
jgi:hypothetical protein